MSEIPQDFDDDEIAEGESADKIIEAKQTLEQRCKAAGISFEDQSEPGEWKIRIGMKCARSLRHVSLWSAEGINNILAIPFEKYVYLADLEAICCYSEGVIEAGIRPTGPGLIMMNNIYRRLFGVLKLADFDINAAKIEVPPTHDGMPRIEISRASETYTKLNDRFGNNRLTIKLTQCHITTHDSALILLQKIAGSVLFQIDLLSDMAFVLERERKRPLRKLAKTTSALNLQYPRTQYDKAPLALYSYARSASGMPLLQFLAFYQVVEFYFPIYSQSEAHRKLKTILKNPTFRGDRDADIAQLLSAIHVSRSGAFGDERSQLKATILECTDPDSIRNFLESDEARKEFFQTKAKSLPYHKLPLANPTADLRGDVAERIYDIRCKIVHTKSDSRDGAVEILLPFTPEAEQLSFDIELVRYVAQQILIAASSPLNVHG